MIGYMVFNSDGNPASNDFDDLAIYETRKAAQKWVDYLVREVRIYGTFTIRKIKISISGGNNPLHDCVCGFCGKKMIDQATNKRYRIALEKIIDGDENSQYWQSVVARTALNPIKTPQEEK